MFAPRLTLYFHFTATLKDLDETMKSAPGDVDGIVKSLAVTIKCLVVCLQTYIFQHC